MQVMRCSSAILGIFWFLSIVPGPLRASSVTMIGLSLSHQER